MVGRSPLTSRVAGAALLVGLFLGGCASSAPPLPADTTGTTSLHPIAAEDFTPSDAALSCVDIATQRADLKAQMEKANANIAANRQTNQVAGYIGSAVLPL